MIKHCKPGCPIRSIVCDCIDSVGWSHVQLITCPCPNLPWPLKLIHSRNVISSNMESLGVSVKWKLKPHQLLHSVKKQFDINGWIYNLPVCGTDVLLLCFDSYWVWLVSKLEWWTGEWCIPWPGKTCLHHLVGLSQLPLPQTAWGG